MAPNLQVARVNAYEYAITSRGFNNRVGNKLLVMLDGRTLYTPMFSGVFWEMQDTNLEDIERIEVISGPGGTLWGANAVNGVINIITRNASQTRSTLVSATAGKFERGATLRTGGRIGERLDWRVFAKTSEWDHTFLPTGAAGVDAFDRQQVGFRADYSGEGQQLSLQGDTMRAESQHRGFAGALAIPPVKLESSNLQGNWTRQLDSGSELNVQAYYTYNMRDEFVLFSPESSIYDLEANHHFTLAGSNSMTHDVLWGGGMRHATDDVEPGVFSIYIPDNRELDWQNLYAQDEIRFGKLRVTPGIKLEWNDFTGMEHLPSVNLAWEEDSYLLWSSWSRVIRAPSRFDRDVYFPEKAPFIIAGGPNFRAEVAHVLEAGVRTQPTDSLSYAVTLFHYNWDRLRSATALPFPLYLVNNIEGESYGVEAWATWQLTSKLQVRGGFNTLEKNLSFGTDPPDTAGVNNPTLHNDPDYQWLTRIRYDLKSNVQVDLQLRHVAELTVEPVPDYTELDLRLGWQPLDNVEISLAGSNLLHKRHAEYSPAASRNLISRSVVLGFRWML
jgi:iron complex outermembrane receptor protein